MSGNNIIETISNIFVIIGVLLAFIEYRMQKINELKSAFTIIVNQIDNIEDKINFSPLNFHHLPRGVIGCY